MPTRSQFWGNLPPGPYQVGFRSSWSFDYSRTYEITFSDGATYAQGRKAPRPILINQWYPIEDSAGAEPLTEEDYIRVHADDPALVRQAEKITEVNTGIVARAIVGKDTDWSTEEQAVLQGFFDCPVGAVRSHAVPADQKFPLVIYIAGYGSTTEDNSVLCEWLAAHGYVVLSSAYQNAEGTMIAGREVVGSDVDFLISFAAQFSYVDWNHIGLIGHSGGAQSSIAYQSNRKSAIDAVVSLDTTQDYYGLSSSFFKTYLDDVQPANITVPMLVTASPAAIFKFTDQFTQSDRLYLTIRDLEHDEYISHKVLGNDYRDVPRSESARLKYEALCEFVHAFLDAHLKKEPDGLDEMIERYGSPQSEQRDIHLEVVSAGIDAPSPYDLSSAAPPTPRQLWVLIEQQGVTIGITLLKKYWQADSSHPIYNSQFAFALVDDLLEKGCIAEANRISRAYGRLAKKTVVGSGFFLSWARMYRKSGNTDRAASFYRKALMLAPKNKEALQYVKAAAITGGEIIG